MRNANVAKLLVLTSFMSTVCCVAKAQQVNESLKGYRFLYGIHWDYEEPSRETKAALVGAIKHRLKSAGLLSTARVVENSKLEIKIAFQDESILPRIKRLISKRGKLEFRIVADPETHDYIIKAALAEKNEMNNFVYGASRRSKLEDPKTAIGYWARVSRESQPIKGEFPLRVQFDNAIVRDANTKKLIALEDLPANLNEPSKFTRWLRERGHKDIEVLVSVDDGQNLSNKHFQRVRPTVDQTGNPSVAFEMTDKGTKTMLSFTSEFKADAEKRYRLAVLMDGEVITAPKIQSAISRYGEITGRFTQAEVNELVQLLRSGSIPASLSEKPLEEESFDID